MKISGLANAAQIDDPVVSSPDFDVAFFSPVGNVRKVECGGVEGGVSC